MAQVQRKSASSAKPTCGLDRFRTFDTQDLCYDPYEAATGTTLARPAPPNPAYDFVDTSNGDKIEVKGPVPAVDGVVPEARLDGLIEATVDEANFQTGADRIVVDAEGLSSMQVERLHRELENRISSGIPVDILR